MGMIDLLEAFAAHCDGVETMSMGDAHRLADIMGDKPVRDALLYIALYKRTPQQVMLCMRSKACDAEVKRFMDETWNASQPPIDGERLDHALDAFSTLAQARPELSTPHSCAADILWWCGRPQKAFMEIFEAATCNPEDSLAHIVFAGLKNNIMPSCAKGAHDGR